MYWTTFICNNSNRSLKQKIRDKIKNSLLLLLITFTKHWKNIISPNKFSIIMVINLRVKNYKATKTIKRPRSHHKAKYILPKMYLARHWLNLSQTKSHFHKHSSHWQQITSYHQNYKRSHDNKYLIRSTK